MRIVPKCNIMFSRQKRTYIKGTILMTIISDNARFRQGVIKYSLKMMQQKTDKEL